MNIQIRLIYLYLFAFVGLLVTVVGCVRLVELGLKVYMFPGSDTYGYFTPATITPDGKTTGITHEEQQRLEMEQRKYQTEESQRQRQRDASGAIAMIMVGVPLYVYHWQTIQKEHNSHK